MKKYIAFYPIILGVFLFCNNFVSQSFAMSKSPLVPRLDLAKLKSVLPSTEAFVPLLDLKKLNLSSMSQPEYDFKEIETKTYPIDEFVEACQEYDVLKLKRCLEKYSEDLNFLKDPRVFKAFWDTVESEVFKDLTKKNDSRVVFVREFLSKQNKQAVNFLMHDLNAKGKIFHIAFLNLCVGKCYEMLEVILSNNEIVNLLTRDLISKAISLMLKIKWKEGIELFKENIRGRTMLRNNMCKRLHIID